MMLRSAPPSPFGRKVKMAAKILDLTDRIEVVSADLNDPDDSIRQQNPLGKIPALVLDDGTCLYDSRVICEHLDGLAGGGRLFPSGEARMPAIRLQALADGLMDAGILQVYEARYRPEEKRHQPWLDRQREKVERTLAALEADPPAFDGTPDIGHVTLACALGYLDFRFDGKWRESHPRLVAWLDAFAAAVPAYGETAPHD
ncbi:MAG: glutathione S-transferase [Hyphomicrobiales bacterium]|nr:glutathione S-transferase [Hyphomicrobiales bacterium]